MYQNFLVDGETFTQTETVAVNDKLSSKDQILLMENALIVVRRDPNFREVKRST